MGHELEIFEDGSASFISRADRPVPWHKLGKTLEGDIDTNTALKEARLADWNVRLQPKKVVVTDEDGNEHTVEDEGRQTVVRTHPDTGLPDVLGEVGGRYKVVQNEDAFSFVDFLLDAADNAYWETAGSINEGRVVFGMIRMPKDIELRTSPEGDVDVTHEYLLVTTSHDGSWQVTIKNTPMRVVCKNTLHGALKGQGLEYRIRHTQSVDGKIAEAKKALGVSYKFMETFQKQAEAMIQSNITDMEFHRLVESIYEHPKKQAERLGKEVSQAAITRWDNKRDQLMTLYKADEAITGTVWGAYNAIVERIDWARTPREGDRTSLYEAQVGFATQTQKDKDEAFERAYALVSV